MGVAPLYCHEMSELVIGDSVSAEASSIRPLYRRGVVRNESRQDYEYARLAWSVVPV
jgi:hypothetical protein